jgi:branched-chain amino acid transport system substrate-binding protein
MAPMKVGLLGLEMERFEREVRMAFDEGQERGLIDRRYELVIEREAGLPQGSAQSGLQGFQRLVDEGCIAVIGANYTDSAWALVDAANAAGVPLVSMCGTDRFHGEYCFRIGNGDLGGDPALICSWLRNEGHTRVAVLAPWSPVAEDYNMFFRQECRRQGISITGIENTSNATTVDELAEKFAVLRGGNPDALVWLGYGGLVVSDSVRPALAAIGWDPPRIMTTAFMQYIWGFEQLEGWVGIDQWCPDNPRMHLFHERFVDRFGEDPWMWPNAIPGLAYDMAAAVVEGIHRAPILTGWGVKTGLERIRFMPAVTGGPNTHLAAGPWDHQMFKGDWLHYGRVRDGRLEFAGLFQPSDAW